MNQFRLFICLPILLLSLLCNAADTSFKYDRHLVINLSVAYVKAYLRKSPKEALPGLDFQHPNVIALRDLKRRKLIFVSFASFQTTAGATATFQQCDEPPLLRVADVGTVDPISSYRDSVRQNDGSYFEHLDDVCPPSDE
jgi:hypothetical protein